jgi:hypothetical protein
VKGYLGRKCKEKLKNSMVVPRSDNGIIESNLI